MDLAENSPLECLIMILLSIEILDVIYAGASALKYFNDTGKLNNDQCNNNSSSICELNPFTNSASNVSSNPLLDGNYLYNYLNYLIHIYYLS